MITGVARRRRFAMDQKLAVVAETMQPGMSISYVARRHGLSPSLVSRWRRLMSEGGKQAIRAEEEVVSASEARKLEDRVRELERLLGRKTMEVEILKEAHDLARTKKTDLAVAIALLHVGALASEIEITGSETAAETAAVGVVRNPSKTGSR
jgi:transposase-like protein